MLGWEVKVWEAVSLPRNPLVYVCGRFVGWELSLSKMYTRTRRVCCRQGPSFVLFLDG